MDDITTTLPRPPDDLPDSVSTQSLINFPFAMVLADPHEDDCPIVYVNELFTEMTGYTAEQAIGHNCRFLQGKDTRPEDRAAIRAAIEAGEDLTIDILNYRADGTPFPNRLMLTPLHDDDGELTYFLGVQSDTSGNDTLTAEARELRERLRELQHRVKNHLAMILAMIRVEARGKPPEEVIRLLTRRVQSLALLYDLFSAEGDGTGTTVPAGAYLSRVAHAMQDIDGRPGIVLNSNMSELRVDMDVAARLGLFLSEVITNALQHGLRDRDEGNIHIDLSAEDGRGTLTIADDGLGMGTAIWPGTRSVGSRIIGDLIRRLQGALSVESGPDLGAPGTRITLRFDVDAAGSD
ncbi:MAG: PAS domain-containing protein [Pseudomonadota bacterium]